MLRAGEEFLCFAQDLDGDQVSCLAATLQPGKAVVMRQTLDLDKDRNSVLEHFLARLWSLLAMYSTVAPQNWYSPWEGTQQLYTRLSKNTHRQKFLKGQNFKVTVVLSPVLQGCCRLHFGQLYWRVCADPSKH